MYVVHLPSHVQLSRPHGLQHARPPCLSPSLKSLPKFTSIASTAVQLSHPDLFFSFCSQSFPASGTFPMSQLFAAVQFSSVLFSF